MRVYLEFFLAKRAKAIELHAIGIEFKTTERVNFFFLISLKLYLCTVPRKERSETDSVGNVKCEQLTAI